MSWFMGTLSQNIFGIRVIERPLAMEIRTEYRVERWPIPKRRKRWRVVRHEIKRPGCWRVGDTLFVHPEIYAKLRAAGVEVA